MIDFCTLELLYNIEDKQHDKKFDENVVEQDYEDYLVSTLKNSIVVNYD